MLGEVRQIESSQTYPFLLTKHYAKRIPSISFAYGLFIGNSLEGVVTYGTSASSTLANGICGPDHASKVIELNRLCLNEGCPKNSASFLVGKSLRLLPKPKIIVSYADTGNGHVGYVYQATNFIYTGLSTKFTDPKVKGLEHQHHATYANGKTNEQLREEFGDRLYFVERSRKHRYVTFVGCHELKKELKYPVLPYPKGDTERHSEDVDVKTTLSLF